MRRRNLLAVAAAYGFRPGSVTGAGASVLVVATSAATTTGGPGGERTGIDLAGFAEVYWLLRGAGLAVEIATVRGGPPPLDPLTGSLAVLPMALRMDVDALQAFRGSRALAAVGSGGHVGLLISDGYGALYDLPTSGPLGALLAAALAAGRPVAAIGHGVAGLLAPGPDGRAVAAGRRVAGSTDAEERAAGRPGGVPFSLETRLREAGALFDAKGVLLENVVRDGPLVTGQNAVSTARTVRVFLDALRDGPA